jgi:hypothetical protein
LSAQLATTRSVTFFFGLLPVCPQSIDDDLMDHGVVAQGRQIDRRFSHIEWVNHLTAQNLLR